MRQLYNIHIDPGSHEEILPGFAPDFPYIATCAALDCYPGGGTPWHWHRPVELFFVQSGCLEYATPKGKWIFPAGSGGFVNANVLHTSTFRHQKEPAVQLLHIFDPSLIAGEPGSRIETRYVLPLTASGVEILPLYPEDGKQRALLERIQEAFTPEEGQWGYEAEMRNLLTEIWLELFRLASPLTGKAQEDGTIKTLLIYIHTHYARNITVEELAQSAAISKRGCFRLFQDTLHTTPMAYLQDYRLRRACLLLARSREPLTQVATRCGLGSSSYFGKLFRRAYGCTPLEYRKKWQDRDIFLRKSDSNGMNDQV